MQPGQLKLGQAMADRLYFQILALGLVGTPTFGGYYAKIIQPMSRQLGSGVTGDVWELFVFYRNKGQSKCNTNLKGVLFLIKILVFR